MGNPATGCTSDRQLHLRRRLRDRQRRPLVQQAHVPQNLLGLEQVSYTGKRLELRTDKSFDNVCKSLESVLGHLDVSTLTPNSSPEQIIERANEAVGSSGFAIFLVVEHGRLLQALGARALKARLYLIGNPLVASEMTRVFPIAGLYAPLRLYVYEEDGATVLTYDQPSSLLSAKEVAKTAHLLDEKFASLTTQAATLP